jgi:endonuclease/exonuclease/phosphatase family metal-dependent hydrolase
LVCIQTPEGNLHLVNWHLGLAELERGWQSRRLLAHDLFVAHSDLPTLVVGDTNDWRNALKSGAFREHGFEQLTQPPSRFRTFPAWLPMGSLDKVFARGPIDLRAAHVVKTAQSREASDHLPLVIDFHLKSPLPSPEQEVAS